MRVFLYSVLLTGTAMIGAATDLSAQETARAPAAGAAEHGRFGFDAEGMDRSVRPGDDFYAFANGTWAKNTEIPADKANHGVITMLEDRSRERVRGILDEASKDPSNMTGRFFTSYLDTARVEALGMAPIQPWLNKIKALNDRASYSSLVVEATQMGISGPYLGYSWQDDKQPDRTIYVLRQGGTGLPDRDMYLVDNPAMRSIRSAYVGHLAKLLTLANEPDAEARAQAVMQMETAIAKVQWTREDSTDSGKTYNKYALADVGQFSSSTFDLAKVLKATSPRIIEVQIAQPSAFKDMAAILDKAPLEVLKDQMLLRSLDGLSVVLPAAIEAESFAFYGTVLSGTPEQEPRWKRGVIAGETALGDAIGKEFAGRYFPPEYKAEMNKLVGNLVETLSRRIDQLDWMRPETKVKAKAKLEGFTVKVGYPDQWRDYAGLEMKSDDLFGNYIRAALFNNQYMVDKVGEAVRRWEWVMPPQVVNAYANYSLKEVVFPAGILQPPLFDPKADMAVNYGAIGAIIGHEISHHFDDQGAQYNEEGKLAIWWTPDDLKAFAGAGKALIAQYEAYEPLPGEHVKGEFTLGENIGDLAGLTIAYDAYRHSLGGKEPPVIDGFTADQLFFLGFAQFWRLNYREADLRRILLTDAHPPHTQRAWSVRNVDAWYDAFGVKPGDKLYLAPSERVRIW